MVQLLRQKRILLSIALNLVIAFLIAFVSVRLFYNNARHGTYHSLTIIGNHEWASIEIYKPYIFAFFKVFIFSIWLLLLFSYILIKTTRPILEELLLNEKDLISNRKETEKKEKGLITLLKNLPVGLIIYDSKAQITHFNDYAISYLGFATNQIKGLVGPPLHLTGEDGSELPIAEHPVNKVITTRAILKNKVVAIVQPSGNMVWVKYNALPVFNFLGNLKQVILTFLEITDHKHM